MFPRRQRARSLFRQVYLHGLLLLLMVALTLGIVGLLLGRDGHWRTSPSRLAQHAGRLLASAPDEALPEQAARLADELDVSLAVTATDGRLLASAGPRPPLDEEASSSGHRHRFRRFGAQASAGAGRSLRLVLNTAEGDIALRAAGILAIVVAVVALVSAPLARAIARPIERLADAARRLGSGDLAARSGLSGPGEIGGLGRTFDEMAERLERLLGAQRQLLADVSHELRTPLARLRVSLALAAEAPAGGERPHLKSADEDVVELEELVASLLTASRLDAGGALVLNREPVDLRTLAEAARERLARLHPGREVALRLQEVPAVSAEAPLLARVLDNLLDNAARYSDRPVELAVEAQANGVLVSVRDQGIGIAPEDQERLFTPFFRTEKSRSRHSGGVGLGLLLSKRIVEAHGGRIEIESRRGEGTRVAFWLPTSPPAGPGAA